MTTTTRHATYTVYQSAGDAGRCLVCGARMKPDTGWTHGEALGLHWMVQIHQECLAKALIAIQEKKTR